MITQATLEALEQDIHAELRARAARENWPHHPITDGVVDPEQYVASSPRMLWILKEPWEEVEPGKKFGGWSVTRDLLRPGLKSNRAPYSRMAYVTHAVFNGFPRWDDIPYVTHSREVATCLQRIAYINVKKQVGGKTSYGPDIQRHYGHMRELLLRQIEAMAPDIVIGGSTLRLFFRDLGLTDAMFTRHNSLRFARHAGRLYLDAYHPSQRTVRVHAYVDDLISAIEANLALAV